MKTFGFNIFTGYVNFGFIWMLYELLKPVIPTSGGQAYAFLWAIPAIMAAAGAIKGAQANSAQKKAEKSNMNANAEVMRYSPWTGMNAQFIQAQPHQSDFMAGLHGGGQGFMGGMGMGGQFGGGAAAKPADLGGAQSMVQGSGSPWAGMSQQYQKKPNMFGNYSGYMNA